jgi:coenzyme F420-dependent glucose-6-phosphate dehydrogenase
MAQFGWKAGPEQFGPRELLDHAVAAEQAGFDALESSDHFHPWSEAGQASFVWTWLGAASAKTGRIGLGTGLTCPILRYHPAVIAQAAVTLAAMAPGRVFLCVGTGEALNEYAATAQWPGYAVRQDMLAEAIQLIRSLWTGDEITHDGTYYQTRKARLYTLPKEPIPIYISSLVPNSATFAGFHGDGFLSVGGKEPALYQQMLRRFEEGARSAGKDPMQMPRLIELNVAYGTEIDGDLAAMKKYWGGALVPALYNQKIYTPKDSQENGKVVGPDTMRKMMCFRP